MNQEVYKRAKSSPKFSELVKRRDDYALVLSVVIFIAYFLFILLIAFRPESLGESVGDSVVTIGIVMGVSIILLCIVLSGLYVKKANKEFDALVDEIKEDARHNF